MEGDILRQEDMAGLTPACELLLGVLKFTHYTVVIEFQQQKLISVPEYGDKEIETAIHDF
ncbi:hypothetical protein VEK44_001725 [Cronobacter sakazakii]|nr:hypothetical protein [Cronobacter sakazakii]